MRRKEYAPARDFLRQADVAAQSGPESYHDLLFISAFLGWQMAREDSRTTQARILFGRLKYLRSMLESRFAEVNAFDSILRGERHHA